MGTEYWNGAEAAHRRVMMKAAGYSDKDIRKKPHIGVPNSYMAGSPGSAHLRQIAEAVKEGVWYSGYLWKYCQWSRRIKIRAGWTRYRCDVCRVCDKSAQF